MSLHTCKPIYLNTKLCLMSVYIAESIHHPLRFVSAKLSLFRILKFNLVQWPAPKAGNIYNG